MFLSNLNYLPVEVQITAKLEVNNPFYFFVETN